jgi:putative membrane protein
MLTIAHIGSHAHAAGVGFFWLGPLLFLLLLGGLLIFMIARRDRLHWAGPGGHHMSPGLKVLDERYASGEIEREDYLAKREDLTSRPQKPDKKK